MAGAAAKLIAMHARATPDYVNNAVLTVPGHLGHAPYNLFAASVSSSLHRLVTRSALFIDVYEIDVLYSPVTVQS